MDKNAVIGVTRSSLTSHGHFQQKLQELEQRYDQESVRHDERSSQMETRLQNLFTQPDSRNTAVPPGMSTVAPSVSNEFAGSPRVDVSRLSSG